MLVLHAWWGLNETIKDFCRRLAGEGFVVFAPDLYHGRVATTIAAAETLGAALDENYQQAQAATLAAARYLDQRATGDGIAVVGFSLGAYYALELSNAEPDLIHSVVVYYGSGAQDFSNAGAAYLAHFAADDPYEPEANMYFLEKTLQNAGRPVTIHRYPATGHWFAEPDRSGAYDEAAADLAWARTLTFLQRPL